MITVTESHGGCVLAVRAQPGARQTSVLGEHSGALKVGVTAPPEDGRANQALVDALRGFLGLKRSQVQLVSGQTRRDKRFLITGVAKDEIEKRVNALVS
jgi:uncharacterized protein (TIGR00251 family)